METYWLKWVSIKPYQDFPLTRLYQTLSGERQEMYLEGGILPLTLYFWHKRLAWRCWLGLGWCSAGQSGGYQHGLHFKEKKFILDLQNFPLIGSPSHTFTSRNSKRDFPSSCNVRCTCTHGILNTEHIWSRILLESLSFTVKSIMTCASEISPASNPKPIDWMIGTLQYFLINI